MLRYERKAAGGLLHLDTKKQARFAPSGQRAAGERSDYTSCAGWQALHVAIDAHSRGGFSLALSGETAKSALPPLLATQLFQPGQ